MPDTVLLTGITGFVGLHCAVQLLREGYEIHGTLRDASRQEEVMTILAQEVPEARDRVRFFEADLMSSEGWAEAATGATYAMHVASPFVNYVPKNEKELIEPAVQGTLRLLSAAANAGVKRTVVTSSMVAIWYGHPPNRYKPFSEKDWTNPDSRVVSAYARSKTLAEMNAWDFINTPAAKGMELSVINPGLILGPNLGSKPSTSAEIITQLMNRKTPGVPHLGYPPVDVRDVAVAHVKALTVPEAAGSRFVCCIDHVWWQEIARVLQAHYERRGYRIPTTRLPDFLPKWLAKFRSDVKLALPDIGAERHIDNGHIRRVLGWDPRLLDEMVIDMADSLIAQGHIKKPKKASI